jgi:hypothetical protein
VLEPLAFCLSIVGLVPGAVCVGKLTLPEFGALLDGSALDLVPAQLLLRVEIPAAGVASELIRTRTGWGGHMYLQEWDAWRSGSLRTIPGMAARQ